MARLWAKTVTFESVNVGDTLPILVKWETQDTINRFAALLSGEDATGGAESVVDEEVVEEAEAAAEPEATSAADLAAPALLAYVTELLEKAFPVTGIMAQGSRLDLELLAPVRPEDTISLTGRVVDKREEEDRRLVECEVVIDNQGGLIVARAAAVVAL